MRWAPCCCTIPWLAEIDQKLFGLSRPGADSRPPVPEQESPPALPTDLRTLVLDSDGRVVRSLGQSENDPGMPDLASVEVSELREQAGAPFDLPDVSGEGSWRVLVEEHDDGTLHLAAQSLDGVDSTLRQLVFIEFALGAVILTLLGVSAVAAVRGQLRPLHRIEATAQSIAGGDFEQRVPEEGTATETRRLAAALNTMLEELSPRIA